MKTFLSIRRMSTIIAIAGFLLAIILFSSCSKDDKTPRPDVAGLMAFNLTLDKPLIGVALSGNRINTALTYTSYTGGYVGIFPGTRSTSAIDASTNNIFASEMYTYEPNKYYSLFVIGINGTYKNMIVNDNLDSLSGIAGKSYIRYINAIPDSSMPMVTIHDDEKEVVNDNPMFSTVSAFVPVKSGSVKIDIDNGSTIQAERTINLEEQKTYTVLFIGNPASNGTTKDSVQIRYVVNGTLKLDSTTNKMEKSSE